MPFPVGVNAKDADTLATEVNANLLAMLSVLRVWRDRTAASTPLSARETQNVLQTCASVRNFVETNKAAPGLAQAYGRKFSGYSGTLATDWATAKTALDTFVNWLIANWPQKSAAGHPAWAGISATNQEAIDFTVTLTATQRTTVVGHADAVLAAFN
jgi:hypothetical protein